MKDETILDSRSTVRAHFGFRPGQRAAPQAKAPTYSLITIVRNAAPTLERTLKSVARQSYSDFEYIVVDAGSTDGTIEILRRYEHLITSWCSEPDRGTADGQNKGIGQASGKYIGYVYADDWLEDDFIEQSVTSLASGGKDFVFGDMNYYVDGRFLCQVQGDGNYKKKILYCGPTMNYPTLSACRTVFERVGLFNTQYIVAPDYEWLFRVHHGGFEGGYDPRIVYNFSIGGLSTRNQARCAIEVARAASLYGGSLLKIWGYAALKIAFHAVDDRLRESLSPAAYGRIRSFRKSLTG